MTLKLSALSGLLCLGLSQMVPAEACTRALYVSDDGLVVTGRSMDWPDDLHSDLWLFPED